MQSSTTNSPKTAPDQLIHLMLKAMEIRVDELKSNVKISQEVLPMGIHTDLAALFKKVLEDPITQLLAMKQGMDSSIASLVTRIVKEFFSINLELIEKIAITETGVSSELHFSIVLKEDKRENRAIIFSFLRDYKNTNLWENFPIYFQFVPKEISNKILVKEIIVENGAICTPSKA
jgi:hypothetical protein